MPDQDSAHRGRSYALNCRALEARRQGSPELFGLPRMLQNAGALHVSIAVQTRREGEMTAGNRPALLEQAQPLVRLAGFGHTDGSLIGGWCIVKECGRCYTFVTLFAWWQAARRPRRRVLPAPTKLKHITNSGR